MIMTVAPQEAAHHLAEAATAALIYLQPLTSFLAETGVRRVTLEQQVKAVMRYLVAQVAAIALPIKLAALALLLAMEAQGETPLLPLLTVQLLAVVAVVRYRAQQVLAVMASAGC